MLMRRFRALERVSFLRSNDPLSATQHIVGSFYELLEELSEIRNFKFPQNYDFP